MPVKDANTSAFIALALLKSIIEKGTKIPRSISPIKNGADFKTCIAVSALSYMPPYIEVSIFQISKNNKIANKSPNILAVAIKVF